MSLVVRGKTSKGSNRLSNSRPIVLEFSIFNVCCTCKSVERLNKLKVDGKLNSVSLTFSFDSRPISLEYFSIFNVYYIYKSVKEVEQLGMRDKVIKVIAS